MTYIHEFSVKHKCSICSKRSAQPDLLSTNSYGPPDLDIRPNGMERDTMNFWVQICPKCGYAAKEISTRIGWSKKFLIKRFIKSDEYKKFSLPEPIDNLEKAFIWEARINDKIGNFADAALSYLYAAWRADDSNDVIWALQARLLAIEQLDKFDIDLFYKSKNPNTVETEGGGITEDEDANRINNLILIKADLLRKTEQYERLINECKDIKFDSEVRKAIEFQLKKAKEKDRATYNFGDIE